MVTFPDVPLGIFLFCMCVIAIGAVQVGTPACRPHLLVLLENVMYTCCAHVRDGTWCIGAVVSCPRNTLYSDCPRPPAAG